MKFNRKEIKELAIRNLQYDTDNPFEATLRAVETWMGKNNISLVQGLYKKYKLKEQDDDPKGRLE